MYNSSKDVIFDCECNCINDSIGSVNVEYRDDRKIFDLGAVNRGNNDEEKSKIEYNKMGGRPSMRMKLNGNWRNCLLDTGARINVIDKENIKDLGNVQIRSMYDGISCANGSALKVLGRTILEVEINQKKAKIEFVIAENVSPKVIAGISLLSVFGIQLRMKETVKHMNETIFKRQELMESMCSLEANFGGKVDDELRFKNTVELLGVTRNSEIYDILAKNKGVFMANKWDIGKTNILKHTILTSEEPILIKPRRQPANLENKISEAIENLEANDIIKKCNSAWNTPLVCIWKKEKKDIRLCLDFRALNKVTQRYAFPMPNIEEMLEVLNGCKYFSTIDLGNAYYQVELDEESKTKTAFSTKSGQYCFNRMPFGIAAAPATFQKLMTIVLGDLNWKEAVVYLDDILIFSKTLQEHKDRLNRVLSRIGDAGLRVNPEKCKFFKSETKFLGHVINQEGIQTDSSKIEAIVKFERPKCIKKLRSFLGVCNYYRKFIKDYAKLARNLESICGSNKDKLVWSEECDNSFQRMKEALSTTPILVYPDFQKEFILDTDASFDTIGAVLSQLDERGNERVIAYGSHAMSKHELGYCITRKELLAIYYFTQHFKHYLYGKRFKLRTDHKAITFMLTTKNPITAQFQNWINFLSSLDMELSFRKGVDHSNADALSRNNCETCVQCRMEHEDAKKGKLKTRALAILTEYDNKEWQETDPEMIRIKEEIVGNKSERFKLIDNMIMTLEGKIWIPETKCKDFINSIHKMLCHAGTKKVLDYIEIAYDMKNMHKLVHEVIGVCENCQKRKSMTSKTKEIIIKSEPGRQFEVIHMDFCGPLRTSFHGKKYIMAIIDQFSRYMSLTAVSNQDEKTTKEILLNKWIFKFGAPKVIHVDCGKTFESKSIRELADKHNIKLKFSSPYHHSSNGLVERQFRTIRDFINTSLKEKKYKDWTELIPEIEFALNATIQKTIGKSPAEVVFGQRIYHRWCDITKPEDDRDGMRKLVLENENKVKYNNVGRVNRKFNINEAVLIKAEGRTKEEDRFIGPFKIIRQIHERSYELQDEKGRRLIRNVEWLKPFKAEVSCDN
jgi:transposase InsO family protein